jgi:hypothetical protein
VPRKKPSEPQRAPRYSYVMRAFAAYEDIKHIASVQKAPTEDLPKLKFAWSRGAVSLGIVTTALHANRAQFQRHTRLGSSQQVGE